MLPFPTNKNGSKSILIQNDSRELNITTEDAKNWIETNIYQNEPKNLDLLRNRYLGRLGIITGGIKRKEVEGGGEKEEEGKEEEKGKREEGGGKRKEGEMEEEGGKKEGNEKREDEDEEEKLKIEKSYSSGEYMINFFQKSDEQVRKNYLDKLIRSNILKTSPSKKQQSCNIFLLGLFL